MASAKEKLLDNTNQLKTLARQYLEKQIAQDLYHRLNYNYLYHNKFPAAVKKISYSNGLYDFILDNDNCFNNVKFTKSANLSEGYLSSDMKLGLFFGKVNTQREFVTTWLVASISSNYDDIFQNIDSWAENIRTNESLLCNENTWDYENKLYGLRSEISVTLGDLNYIPFDIASKMEYPSEMDMTVAGNARREILAYLDGLNQAEAKELVAIAYEVCGTVIYNNELKKLSQDAGATIPGFGNTKGAYPIKPEDIILTELKSYEINGDSYTFLNKDKTVIADVHFNKMVPDLDYSYHDYGFLSDDKRFALITHHNNLTKDFIYLIEFEGDGVKSISSIPYKKSKDFVMPQL